VSQATSAGNLTSSRRIIERPRLTRLIDAAEARVVSLVAPAGYGKTTLARQWLEHRHVPHAWFRATAAGSADFAAVALGVAQAMESVAPHAATAISARLRSTALAEKDTDALADLLLAHGAPWPDGFFLAIDDYHLIEASQASADFIEALGDSEQIRLLLATRLRPRWVTARRLLYGDVYEVGRSVLAMTSDEASQVLTNSRDDAVSGLVALAEGWPAVIGLAAQTEISLETVRDDVPETLHAFFAEELLQSAPPELQTRMLSLSLMPTLTRSLIDALFPGRAEETIVEGVARGFLSVDGQGNPDLHPLLRQFLRSRHAAAALGTTDAIVSRATEFLMRNEDWDDAFDLAVHHKLLDRLGTLFAEGSPKLLEKGRVVTLKAWIDSARKLGVRVPEVDLAQADVAFREGSYTEAESLALSVADSVSRPSVIVSRAYYRAAQSAQLNDDAERALQLHRRAAEMACTDRDYRDAVWGQFITNTELDRQGAAEAALDEFERGTGTPQDLLRVDQARLSMAIRWGGVEEALSRARQRQYLLDRVSDPLLKTAYFQMLGTALFLQAQYEGCLDVGKTELEEAKRFGLDFVVPHAYCITAGAQIGLRRFADARRSLDRAYAKATELEDVHSQMNVLVLKAKMLLIRGEATKAVRLLDVDWERSSTIGMVGEFLAMRALSSACAGDRESAESHHRASAATSNQVESLIPRAWAMAIIEQNGMERHARITETYDLAIQHGHLDSIVTVYRCVPSILETLSANPRARRRLPSMMSHARDHHLARRHGIELTDQPPSAIRNLTPRETEVLALLQEGQSNAEIARALWITEATAKVHVRHILEKLGVKRRTQAALVPPND
jgi:LuxR family transcriptional regulator, maltose regulon positive regulatory protein